MHNLWNF